MKKILVVIIFIVLLISNVFADENVEIPENRKVLVTGIETLDEINLNSKYIITIPADADSETATEYINRKLYEVIHNLQVIAQAFCMLMFIVCAILTILSTPLSSGYRVGVGIFGCILCIVAYVAILYVQEIFQNALAFVAS